MQLTLHATHPTPHGASRLVQAMSIRSVKTRRAPSRHRTDARADGHTTTAVHDNEYTPPPIPRLEKMNNFNMRNAKLIPSIRVGIAENLRQACALTLSNCLLCLPNCTIDDYARLSVCPPAFLPEKLHPDDYACLLSSLASFPNFTPGRPRTSPLRLLACQICNPR